MNGRHAVHCVTERPEGFSNRLLVAGLEHVNGQSEVPGLHGTVKTHAQYGSLVDVRFRLCLSVGVGRGRVGVGIESGDVRFGRPLDREIDINTDVRRALGPIHPTGSSRVRIVRVGVASL